MTPTWRTAAGALVSDLETVFGDRLRSVVAYGPRVDGDEHAPLACLVLVASLDAGDLEKCARLADRWERAGLAIPLVVPEGEFRQSLDAFPLEYGEIIRAHQRVHGEDPFIGIGIAAGDLRRACELQARSHLLHLRESFIESRGRPAAVGRLVAASAPGFTALLRNVARLSGVHTSDRVEATRSGGRAAGVADAMVTDMLDLERQPDVPAADPSRLFPDYLAAVEQLSRVVDRWHDA